MNAYDTFAMKVPFVDENIKQAIEDIAPGAVNIFNISSIETEAKAIQVAQAAYIRAGNEYKHGIIANASAEKAEDYWEITFYVR